MRTAGASGESELWVELPAAGLDGWVIAGRFLRHADRLVLAELRVFPGGSKPPVERPRGKAPVERRPIGEWSESPEALEGLGEVAITARLLRQVRVGDLYEVAQRQLEIMSRHTRSPAAKALADVAPSSRPGRAGRPDSYYAAWAARYAERLAAGSRSPVGDLAAEHGLSRAQVRDLVHEARVRGLLPKGAKGRADGQLTDKARRLLADLDATTQEEA